MCFSLFQASRCSVRALTISWFESFPSSTMTAGSSSSLWLFVSNTCGLEGGHNKKWSRRYTNTKRVGKFTLGCKTSNLRLEISEESITKKTKLKNSKSEVSKFQLVDYGDIQPKLGEPKELASLATVIVLDLETTGLSRESRVVEIALQDLRGGKNSSFQTLVNPECFVPNTNIHGISAHMVNRPGVPRMEDLIPILLQYVKSRQKPGGLALLVGHNARSFDVRILVNEFIRCSYEIPPDWLFMDTLPLARQAMKSEGPKIASPVSLKALCQHYAVPSAGSAHRAMSDVKTLALVLQGLTRDLKLPVSGLIERSFRASINI